MMDEIVEVPKEDEIVYTEVTQTDGQLKSKVYNYRIKVTEENQFTISVIATSGTAAREGLAKQLPSTAAITFLNTSEQVVQFQ